MVLGMSVNHRVGLWGLCNRCVVRHMAGQGERDTIDDMQVQRWVTRLVMAAAVFSLVGCGTDDSPGEAAPTVVKPVSVGGGTPDGTGFAPEDGEERCFAGVCVEDIATVIDVAEAGSYLELFRSEIDNGVHHPIKCHLVAHEIGRSVARGGVDLDQMFGPYRGECTGGYIHGALQVLGGEIDLKANAVRFGELCERGGSYLARIDCIHGYGHAIGAAAGDSGPESAVAVCDVMRDVDRGECAGGVLMQYYQDPAAVTGSIDAAMCERLGRAVYRFECHRSRWAVAMRAGETPEIFAERCTGAGLTECGFGLGYWLRYERDTTEDSFGACATYGANLAEACVAGVVRSEVERGTDDGIRPERYRSVCGDAGTLLAPCQRAERDVLDLFFGSSKDNVR